MASFDRKLCHVGFNDYIVRDDDEFERTRQHIANNPNRRWQRTIDGEIESPARSFAVALRTCSLPEQALLSTVVSTAGPSPD